MRNKYSISEFITTSYSLLLTKLIFPKARLIRRPLYLRGKKSLKYGKQFTLGHSCRFDLEGNRPTLSIGNNCEFGDNTHIVAMDSVTIGNDVLIASKCFISDTNHGCYEGEFQDSPLTKPNDRNIHTKPVSIGNNVWIGENAVILPGVVIGNGCIVGANTVVKGIYPENVMIAGIPSKIVKQWNNDVKRWERYVD